MLFPVEEQRSDEEPQADLSTNGSMNREADGDVLEQESADNDGSIQRRIWPSKDTWRAINHEQPHT